jgi:hypothetical protein
MAEVTADHGVLCVLCCARVNMQVPLLAHAPPPTGCSGWAAANPAKQQLQSAA